MGKSKGGMGLHWDGTIGPAFIVGVGGSLSVLVTIGWMWANQAADTKAAAKEATDAKNAIVEADKRAEKRDAVINDHSVTLGKIVTQLNYVGPQLDRIEKKLDVKN
jgi:hypothetical protein